MKETKDYFFIFWAKTVCITIVKFYQQISFLFPSLCKFYPSCSHYALGALRKFSLIKALALIIRRLLRCQPFSRGGIDYLPER